MVAVIRGALTLGLTLWCCWLWPLPASGQGPRAPEPGQSAGAAGEGGQDDEPVVMTPPKLSKFVEAPYPEEAFTQGLSGTVVLELLIGADGTVQEAKVVQSAGHGFDEAALKAAQQFVFEPARKGEEPIPARVRYPYVFEIRQEEAAPEPEAPPAPGRLEGQVLAGEDNTPIAQAEVVVASMEGAEVARVESDAQGRFVVPELPEGSYLVSISKEGRRDTGAQEDVLPGAVTDVVYRLEEPPDPDAFGAVARVPAPPREVTRRSIGKQQLTRIPGTRGDALRAVELMPGVARPPLGAGALIVRGSAPNDTQTLFEGLPVVLLYHFGGLTSFVNSRLLEDIDFIPGNFSVRYGRRRGGVVEVRAADPPRDTVHGVADVNLIDASLLVQAPLSEDAEITIAARRSYFDVLFEGALEDADISAVAAPVYYDYQIMGTYRPSARDKLRLMVFGSSDAFELLFEQPTDTDAAIAGDFDLSTQFHRAHASWRRQLSKRVDQDIDIAMGYVDVDFGLGQAFDFNLSGYDIYARSEWRGRLTDQVRLIGGLDLYFLPGQFTYAGPPVAQTEGNPDAMGGASFSNRDRILAEDEFTVVQPAAYLESDLNLAPFRILLGSRIDYFREINEYTFDPRFTAHYTVSESTILKSGIGLFSQPPEFPESSAELGNPDLEATRSLHIGAGVEQRLGEAFSLGVDGFYKHMYRSVVGTEFGEEPFFTNDGQGRIYGLELSARVEPRGRFFGYLSYTLSRSERKDRETEPWRLFDFDQPHILTAAAVYRLGNGWEAGATFRLVSGNPNTPIVGANLNTLTAQYSPIHGRVNSARNPAFNRLDLRIEKQWDFEAWKLALYLDVQNVYNAENPEGYVYDFEFRQRQAIRGLPIIPNLGVRGEM